MAWLNKFQQGGQLSSILKQVQTLVSAAAQGDQQALSQIKSLMMAQDPQSQQILQAISQSNPELLSAMEQLASQTPSMKKGGVAEYLHSLKCGGKTPAAKCGKKVKKASCGCSTKKEKGGWLTSKGKCGCALKRVGGQIVEVDSCTGLPIYKAQQGMSLKKFQTPSGPITHANTLKGWVYTYDPSTRTILKQTLSDKEGTVVNWDDIKAEGGVGNLLDKLYSAGITNPFENVYLNKNANGQVEWRASENFNSGKYNLNGNDGLSLLYKNGKYYGHNNHGLDSEWSNEMVWEKASQNPQLMKWLQTHNNYGYKGDTIDYKEGKATWDPTRMKYVYQVPSSSVNPPVSQPRVQQEVASAPRPNEAPVNSTPASGNTAYKTAGSKLKYNGKTYDEALALQKELLAAGYDLGKYGADGYWGKTSQAAYEKYLRDKEMAYQAAMGAPIKGQVAQVAIGTAPAGTANKGIDMSQTETHTMYSQLPFMNGSGWLNRF